jgi:hypothetical protein
VWLACGAALLLIVAGTLEAFVSPSPMPEAGKLALGGASAVLLYSWLLLAGRSRRASSSRRRTADAMMVGTEAQWT